MDQSSPNRPRRSSRTWSHRSDKSNGSKPKESLAESAADKQRRDSFWKGGSKANPNAAINEAQPGDAAIYEKATIESLRSFQHKDQDGNIIAEPDLANPTRSRWERPLDTIKSFDRNIEAGYKRRTMSRSESYEPREQYTSNRSSYYGGHDGRYNTGTPSVATYNGGYYGAQRRPDGYMDNGSSPAAPPSRNRFGQRMGGGSGTMSRSHSSYAMAPQQNHGYHESYEAGVSSDSTGPWNNSTDPSSENSSIDRAQAAAVAVKNAPPMEGYGYNDGFGNGAPIMEEYDSGSDGYGMSRHGNLEVGPPVPNHYQAPPVRAPIQLGGSSGAMPHPGGHLPPATRPTAAKEEKKKGFFKKRFSKG